MMLFLLLYFVPFLLQLTLLTQGVYCFHSQRHTFYQWTEEQGEKSSDEVGTALFNWIYDAKVLQNRPFTQLHIFFDNCSGELIIVLNLSMVTPKYQRLSQPGTLCMLI